MNDSQVLNFNAGSQAFYGMMKLTIISGTPTIMGAVLSPGYSQNLFAPLYQLPMMIESDSPFSINVQSLPSSSVAQSELNFYSPRETPEGFNKIGNFLYHSPLIKGVSVPTPVEKFVDRTVTYKTPSIIMICGGKGAGKSTFSRYVVNKLLNNDRKVVYLDIDPGQPEFSLPGVLSLTFIDSFSLLPPEHNTMNRNQIKIYYGSNSPNDNLEYFMQCIKYLMDQYRQIAFRDKSDESDSFLVVNSFGWIQDLGFTIHQELINDIIKPKQVILLYTPDTTPPQLAEKIFKYQVQPKSGVVSISPLIHRNIRIHTYFRRNRDYLVLQQPNCIQLRDVRISFITIRVPPTEALTVLSGSIVGLLNDPRHFPRSKTLVSLLKEPPQCPCVGFGFIRSIDKEKGLLYITIPENEVEFNTIALGNIFTPAQFFNETSLVAPNYLGVGLLDKVGASTDPLLLKNPTVMD